MKVTTTRGQKPNTTFFAMESRGKTISPCKKIAVKLSSDHLHQPTNALDVQNNY